MTFNDVFGNEEAMRKWSAEIIRDYNAEQNESKKPRKPVVIIACNKRGLIPVYKKS